jgi:ATP-dependent Clp protease ATP-binding subunit ClpC
MGKVNVYLPDDLERSVRDAGLSVSPICQTALRDAVDRIGALRTHGRGSFTPRLDEVVDRAGRKAAATGHEVGPEDLFGAIVEHGENLGARALTMMGVELPAPRPGEASGDASAPAPDGAPAGELGVAAREVLASGYRIALEMRHPRVGTEHVVIALASPGSPLAPLFLALGIEPVALRRQVERLIANPWTTQTTPPVADLLTIERLDAAVQELAAEVQRLKHPRE